MKRIIYVIGIVISFALQASLSAVDIQTAAGGALINHVDESVVRLWGKLINDLWPAPVAVPNPLPAVIQLPGAGHAAAADYAAINNADHETIKILNKLQEVLPQNPGLFNNVIVNEENILDKVSDIKFYQPENVFAKHDLDCHPKKKIYPLDLTQRNIDPRQIFPLLQAAYTHDFAPQIKSGLARLYALALCASMRQMNENESERDFLLTHDLDQMDQDSVQDFRNLNEAIAAQCAIKNEIKRQYLYLYGRWLDGKSANLTHHAMGLAAAVCDEVAWLMHNRLIPPVIAEPIPAGTTIVQLAQSCFNYLTSWKAFFKNQVPQFLKMTNPMWQGPWWVICLPRELLKEVEKLMLIHHNKRLTFQRIENLEINDLIQLGNAGRVPQSNHIAAPLTIRSIAKQWVQNWAVPPAKTWFYNDEDIWKFVDEQGNPSLWLTMLPSLLVKEICRYYRCALIKKHGKWVDTPHLCHKRTCKLPIQYLTDYGVIPLPQGTVQAGLEGMPVAEQARAYAIDFIAQINANSKNISQVAQRVGCMPQPFKREVCRQYALQTAWRGSLLEQLKEFKDIVHGQNHDDLTTTLTEALQNAEVRNTIATKINQDHVLDLSGMHLRAITGADFVGGVNAIGALPGVNLAQITVLDLSNNQLAEFPLGILNFFPEIQTLKLSHNRLQTLPVGLFGNIGAGLVPRLKSLYCDRNQITQLPQGLLRGLENNATLDVVDLSHNQLQNPDHMPLFGALKVKALNLSNNQLAVLPANIFSHTVGNAGVIPVNILDQSFKGQILELNLSGNQLVLAMNDGAQQALNSLQNSVLEYLDLSNNHIQQVHPLVHCRLNGLKHLFLDNNQVTAIMSQNGAGVVQNMENLVTLSMANNQLAAIAQNDCAPFPNLKRFILSGNHIANIFEGAAPGDGSELSRLTKLELLALDRNALEAFSTKTFKNLKRLMILHLEGNKILRFVNHVFKDLEQLERLYLYANVDTFSYDDQLGVDDTTIEERAFNGLTSLLYLDLSYNRIKQIPAGVFDGLSKLTHLNLGHNKIKSLTDQLDPLVKLQEIDLSANKLEAIQGQTFHTQKHLQHIYFKKNNASGTLSPTSSLALAKLYLPYYLSKVPIAGRITGLLLGKGVNLEMEGLNKLAPDIVRIYRALQENKKFGIPGLLYVFKLIGARKENENFNRELMPLAEQMSTLLKNKKRGTIDVYFHQMEEFHKALAFEKKETKVIENNA